ncbi:hypothetical protein JW979_16565 [bacterium]|nr:hypothetical protein [candidate division CSSED10-310 bacterium]
MSNSRLQENNFENIVCDLIECYGIAYVILALKKICEHQGFEISSLPKVQDFYPIVKVYDIVYTELQENLFHGEFSVKSNEEAKVIIEQVIEKRFSTDIMP